MKNNRPLKYSKKILFLASEEEFNLLEKVSKDLKQSKSKIIRNLLEEMRKNPKQRELSF